MLVVAAAVGPSALAQDVVAAQTITRSTMWVRALPNGALERETSTEYDWKLAYPGHYENRNEASGGFDRSLIYNAARVAGEDVAWIYRNGSFDDSDIFAVRQSQLEENLNLLDPTQPEITITGTIGSYPVVDSRRHMGYELEGRVMAWSQPGYDDFVLVKCRLTNTDSVPFEDFYYTRLVSPDGPYRPAPVSSGWDVEYLWDPEVSDDVGFVFYDDTSLPPTSPPPVYTIPPGDVTGNAGDPGNIAIQGSTDRKLYSPALYAFSFVPSTLTPNKNGERKVWRSILSSSSAAPPEELTPGLFDELVSWTTLSDLAQNRQQPEVGWREARETYQPGDPAGSLYERNPRYFYSIGPYDLAPGESIEWVEVLLAGAMDRDVTILGGLEATTQFVERGLEDLKANWAAARTLIDNDFQFPFGEIPPPTPAEVPRVGNSRELEVAPAATTVDGARVTGVDVLWYPVHQGYTDPQTGEADFAAYRVYRSPISVEGPWELVATVDVAEAEALVEGGRVRYFTEAPVGVPYRYLVTSVDTGGRESGRTGYTSFPVAAEFQPSDDLSDVRVVPNPFRQESGFRDPGEAKRLAFVNIPSRCTITIYTLALDLVRTIEHDGGGEATWGSSVSDDYMLTEFAQNVMPGVYIYRIESHVEGHEGESTVGKLAIIR